MEIAIVGSEEFVLGFRLAGVKKCFEGRKEQADELLASASGDGSVGVVLIEESFFEGLSAQSRERTRAELRPVVLEVGTGEGELRERVVRAVGVDLYGSVGES